LDVRRALVEGEHGLGLIQGLIHRELPQLHLCHLRIGWWLLVRVNESDDARRPGTMDLSKLGREVDRVIVGLGARSKQVTVRRPTSRVQRVGRSVRTGLWAMLAARIVSVLVSDRRRSLSYGRKFPDPATSTTASKRAASSASG
jgi:hypothetical protein